MIALEAAAARRAPLSRGALSLAWDAGLHSVVGAPSDGAPLLLAVAAGRARVRRGRVRVLDGSPTDARVRPQVAWIPLAPALPDALRVREVLALAARVRGDAPRDPAERLAWLGVEALVDRPARTLAAGEARAVAMAEALTSPRVRVLLVEEPLVGVDPRAASRLAGRLRERADEGCAVLVATASVRDAGELADDHVLLRGGVVAGRGASIHAFVAPTPAGAGMQVVTNDPPALAAALAREPDVEAVSRTDGMVVARARDAQALASAVARAVLAAGVQIVEMRPSP